MHDRMHARLSLTINLDDTEAQGKITKPTLSDTIIPPLTGVATQFRRKLANDPRIRTEMAPVKHVHRAHMKDHERSQVIPSDVSETMNEIRDGLNVLFEDSVKRVKETAHT
jgi:hypothetical protein